VELLVVEDTVERYLWTGMWARLLFLVRHNLFSFKRLYRRLHVSASIACHLQNFLYVTHIQGDRKVTQPIWKYLLVVAIQYNSIGLINTQYRCDYARATQVTSCCNLLAPVHHLSLNSRSPRMSFSQVQPVFIVEHYLASRSYLTCQNEFRDTFLDSPVPNKPTVSRLVNRFSDTGSEQDRNRSVASNVRKRVKACVAERGGHFQHLMQRTVFLFPDFNVIYFLTNRTC
jgi:hypothetical protein